MINWAAPETIPPQHRSRIFHAHNANVTLMRSTADELAAAGERIAEQLNRSCGQVRLLMPLGSLSMIDAPGQPFHDPNADAVLFEPLERLFVQSETHRLLALPHHINDPAFSDAVAVQLRQIL